MREEYRKRLTFLREYLDCRTHTALTPEERALWVKANRMLYSAHHLAMAAEDERRRR